MYGCNARKWNDLGCVMLGMNFNAKKIVTNENNFAANWSSRREFQHDPRAGK